MQHPFVLVGIEFVFDEIEGAFPGFHITHKIFACLNPRLTAREFNAPLLNILREAGPIRTAFEAVSQARNKEGMALVGLANKVPLALKKGLKKVRMGFAGLAGNKSFTSGESLRER